MSRRSLDNEEGSLNNEEGGGAYFYLLLVTCYVMCDHSKMYGRNAPVLPQICPRFDSGLFDLLQEKLHRGPHTLI